VLVDGPLFCREVRGRVRAASEFTGGAGGIVACSVLLPKVSSPIIAKVATMIVRGFIGSGARWLLDE